MDLKARFEEVVKEFEAGVAQLQKAQEQVKELEFYVAGRKAVAIEIQSQLQAQAAEDEANSDVKGGDDVSAPVTEDAGGAKTTSDAKKKGK